MQNLLRRGTIPHVGSQFGVSFNSPGEWSPYIYQLKIRMAKRLYVGGLPYSTTEDALREAFSKAGAVANATIITDRMSGRSKGFGFVEMSSDSDAEKAIEMWNGKEFGGRMLTVNEAKPMEARAPRSEGFGGGRDRY